MAQGKMNSDSMGKVFGWEDGFPAIPSKYSGTKISRLTHGEEMGCSYCFPHGRDTINNHYRNYQRSWKKHQKNQYSWK